MNSGMARLIRGGIWLLVTVLVVLAILVSTIRFLLPDLNRYQAQIKQVLHEQTGLDLQLEAASGSWHNLYPSLSLQGLQIPPSESLPVTLSAQSVEVEFDLWQSLFQWQPVIANLTTQNLHLDLRQVALFESPAKSDTDHHTTSHRDRRRLDSLFLRQLDNFSLLDSQIQYRAPSGDEHQLDIEKLRWQNIENHHRAEGVISVADRHLNSLMVNADFIDHGSLGDVSGEFYVAADHQSLTPWLSQTLQQQTGIQRAQLSFQSWFELEHSRPQQAYVDLKPSQLVWKNGVKHHLNIHGGVFQLQPTAQGWRVSGRDLNARTDGQPWRDSRLALDWQQDQSWRLNVSQLNVAAVAPLATLLPNASQSAAWLTHLKPAGILEDIRIEQGQSLDSLRYSAHLRDGALAQWERFPEIHRLTATLSGSATQARAKVSLVDDVLPYGEMFQAPLNIKQGELDIVWQKQPQGWQLWADKVTVATPDLQVLGAFRLDFPKDGSPFLSFYAETDLYNAGETWRYLPTPELGQSLTDYLSTALQAGQAKTAKLLWFGALNDYPYHQHNGQFQAQVGLTNAQFSFDTAWPPLTDMHLDLLFQNDALYLDSHAANLMQVKAQRIKGRIPELSDDGHIEIEATATAQGQDLRDYMMATPLVGSVGSALTAVQVDGDVNAQFRLTIPFDAERESRAWGWANLPNNHVTIKTPALELDQVSGRIHFDNDVIRAEQMKATLLDQAITLGFNGESVGHRYDVDLNLNGDWQLAPLAPYLGQRWIQPLDGHAPWEMGIGLQLNDVGFTYQLDAQADLLKVSSHYPYPLDHAVGITGKAHLQAAGDQERIAARVSVPNAKYQADIDIRHTQPLLAATYLALGDGEFKIRPIGHQADIHLDKLNVDEWLSLLNEPSDSEDPNVKAHEQEMPAQPLNTVSDHAASPAYIEFPMPDRVDLTTDTLTLGGLDWHQVELDARNKNLKWLMRVDSQEAKGELEYTAPNQLSAKLAHLHLSIPALDEALSSPDLLPQNAPESISGSPDMESTVFHALPDLTVSIEDMQLQGHPLGALTLALRRQDDQLNLQSLQLESGQNRLVADGTWSWLDQQSHTTLNVDLSGKNNSELMEQLGIRSDIQKAPFHLALQTDWQGAPWLMRVDTLKGKVNTKLGKGIISNVGGAARVLGLFSLDSILRKMQLDFSGVFDDGLAFNSITGSGEIRNGIFITDDLRMDALAGEMTIKGMTNLNTRMVDAEVHFVPDITSGIPVLSAFAVTPQTALYVLAVTTVLAPVVEVFTQVDYEVKGAIDSPKVTELSRRKGKRKLPLSLREHR